MTHKRETCRMCGERTRRLFTHVVYTHADGAPIGVTYADYITALMRRARGQGAL